MTKLPGLAKASGTSIQFRLTAAYTAVLALTFALIGTAVVVALNHSIQETADRELRSRLADVRRYYNGFSENDLRHLEEEFREESLLSQSTANIRICDKSGKWLFRAPGTEQWPATSLDLETLPRRGRFQNVRIGRATIRILSAPLGAGLAQIGLPIDEFEEVKSGFLWLIGLASPLLLLLAWIGGFWMSGRALRPVDEISSAAARIGANKLSARLPVRGVGDELDRLSGVLNDMLSRLETAFKRISEFTADASHELRTPVAVIQTTAELMQAQPRTAAEHVQAWRRVSGETERTSRLLSDLLTLARADAGRSDLDLRPIDLAEVLRAAVDEMTVMAHAKTLALELKISGPAAVMGDEDSLRRLLCILLDNAIKFTEPGGQVTATLEGRQLIISDTGLGIPEPDLPFVFERFYRVSKDRSRKTGGSGLGLAIAYTIVQQHRGRILVESEPGKGSRFIVELPDSQVSTIS